MAASLCFPLTSSKASLPIVQEASEAALSAAKKEAADSHASLQHALSEGEKQRLAFQTKLTQLASQVRSRHQHWGYPSGPPTRWSDSAQRQKNRCNYGTVQSAAYHANLKRDVVGALSGL